MDPSVPKGWEIKGEGLEKTFHHATFPLAVTFVNEVASLSEAANHHPEIDLRYRHVRLYLTTHSAGNKITSQDVALAEKINQIKLP